MYTEDSTDKKKKRQNKRKQRFPCKPKTALLPPLFLAF